MNTATRKELKPETVDRLRELIQVNIDSSEGFRQAATITENPTLKSMFHDLARQRSQFADELKTEVPSTADGIPTEVSWLSKAHHWWMDVRTKMAIDSGYSLLAEVESAEDRIKAAYESLVRKTEGSPVHPLLENQYVEIRSLHDRIRAMRETARVKSSR